MLISREQTLVDAEHVDTRERQESFYNDAGITVDSVRATVERLKGFIEWRDDHVLQVDALYVNPSDSLELLNHTRGLEGAKILTVGGSGEFAQTFIEHGAKSVDIVDVSPSVCFLNELKLVAAQQLSYEEYLQLFSTIDTDHAFKVRSAGSPHEEDTWKLFDPNIYQRIREKLSIQARTFFDTIIQPGYEPLFTFNSGSWNGPVRFRPPYVDKYKRQGNFKFQEQAPHLKHRELFEHLKQRIGQTDVAIKVGDIRQLDDYSSYDYIYLSNVTYGSQILTAGKLLDKGARRIGLTLNDQELKTAQPFDERKYEFDPRILRDEPKPPEVQIVNEELAVEDYGRYGTEDASKSLKTTGQLIGIDRRSGYGSLVEIKK
jgi:hypothetical protein